MMEIKRIVNWLEWAAALVIVGAIIGVIATLVLVGMWPFFKLGAWLLA